MIHATRLYVLEASVAKRIVSLSELKNYKDVLLTIIRVYCLSLDHRLWVFRSIYYNPQIAYRSGNLIMGDVLHFPMLTCKMDA